MATATKDSTPGNLPTAADDRLTVAQKSAFQSMDPAACFAHFRPLAEQVPTEGLAVFNADAALVLQNVKTAVSVLGPRLPEVALRLVDPPFVAVLELPSLALALLHAANRVPARKLSEGEIRDALAEVAPMRALTLTFLDVASDPALGLLPTERVRAVRAGKGPLDLAGDAVVLSDLFAEYGESLSGKHPFRPEQLTRMAELGALLLQSLKPGRAPASATAREPAAVLRDQFAALLADRYEELRLCASVVFRPSQAAVVIPALRASSGQASAATEAGEPTKPDAPKD